MHRLLLLLVFLLLPTAATLAQAPAPPVPAAVDSSPGADVAYLASDALEGRATGEPGNALAALFVAGRFEQLGLLGAFPDPSCEGAEQCGRTYFQDFEVRPLPGWPVPLASHYRVRNVAGYLPGADPAVSHEVVVVGAHYDHMGRRVVGVRDRERGPAIHNGADDNASGTAAILELARRLAADRTRRSVLFVAFGAEELGMLGSEHFLREPPAPVQTMVAMLNFDMVGRMRGDRLAVYGAGSAPGLRALVEGANLEPKLELSAQIGSGRASDHAPFAERGVPALHFFTGVHGDYHRATDDAERINLPGMVRVVDLAERVVRAIADRPARLAPPR